MIDHGAVVIRFPGHRGGDSVRHLDLEHLTIERFPRGVGADPVIHRLIAACLVFCNAVLTMPASLGGTSVNGGRSRVNTAA